MNIFLDANICLDMLDSTRKNHKNSVRFYLKYKDDESVKFYFSGDFLTTIFYVLTEKKGHNKIRVLKAIDKLSQELEIVYLTQADFIKAKNIFYEQEFKDFEDLLILCSADRKRVDIFVTRDKNLLKLKKFDNIKIVEPI